MLVPLQSSLLSDACEALAHQAAEKCQPCSSATGSLGMEMHVALKRQTGTPRQVVCTLRPGRKELQQVRGVVLQAMLPGEQGSLQPPLVKQQHRSASACRNQRLAPACLQRQPEHGTAESTSLTSILHMCSAKLALQCQP